MSGARYEDQGTGRHTAGREAREERNARRGFMPSDHIRPDWTVDELVEMLEQRPQGYSGLLRQALCTSAQRLRDQKVLIRNLEEVADAAATEMDEVITEMRARGDQAEMPADAEEQGERVANAKVKAHEDGTEMVDASALMPVGVEEDIHRLARSMGMIPGKVAEEEMPPKRVPTMGDFMAAEESKS